MTTIQPRPYHSPLRDEQSEYTRQVILDALAEQLAFQGPEDFSIPKAARRARVAVRTVYRYFPTREHMLEAIARWIDDRVGRPPTPGGIDALVALVPRMFRAFADHGALIRGLFGTRNGVQMRLHANQERARAIEACVADEAPGLSPPTRTELAALLHALAAPGTLFMLKEVYGFDVERASRAAQWAMRVLVDAARTAEPRE